MYCKGYKRNVSKVSLENQKANNKAEEKDLQLLKALTLFSIPEEQLWDIVTSYKSPTWEMVTKIFTALRRKLFPRSSERPEAPLQEVGL